MWEKNQVGKAHLTLAVVMFGLLAPVLGGTAILFLLPTFVSIVIRFHSKSQVKTDMLKPGFDL